MAKTANDFTNTFRILSDVTKSGDNTDVVKKLLEQSAPKDYWVSKARSKYMDNPRIEQALKVNPGMLEYFGLDPE